MCTNSGSGLQAVMIHRTKAESKTKQQIRKRNCVFVIILYISLTTENETEAFSQRFSLASISACTSGKYDLPSGEEHSSETSD